MTITRASLVYSIVTLVSLSILGCGFQLRGIQPLPENIDGVTINAPTLQSRLARQLSDRLKVYQLKEIAKDQAGRFTVVNITLQPENLERRLLSLFSTGQVAEYELIYSTRYTVTFPDKKPISSYVEVLREYQDDPAQVLAKARELEVVLSEMRFEAADRIIRLLSSQSQQNESSNTPSSSGAL